MSTTKTGGIFTFDHGQKRLCNAIGVTPEYLEELGEQVSTLLKGYVFNENKEMKEDLSPSGLVELAANEFSYSQLVILSSFYLQDKLDDIAKKLESKLRTMKSSVRSISLDSDDIPPHIKKLLEEMSEGNSEGNPIDGDSLPAELSAFLRKLAEEQQRQEGDGDDD